MPLGPGVRYRVKTYPSGEKVRLAFKGNEVVEAKKLHKKRQKRAQLDAMRRSR